MGSCGHTGGDRYWIDHDGVEHLRACCREWHRCRMCKRRKPAGFFGASRIRKRDYECMECHRFRCMLERAMGHRGKHR